MRKIIFLVSLFIILSFKSIPLEKKTENNYAKINSHTCPPDTDDGLALLEQFCLPCHTASDEKWKQGIAPAMKEVRKIYLKKYPDKKDFVQAIKNWVPAPSQEKALFDEAVQIFGVMPPMPFENQEDLEKIAETIYEGKFLKNNK